MKFIPISDELLKKNFGLKDLKNFELDLDFLLFLNYSSLSNKLECLSPKNIFASIA